MQAEPVWADAEALARDRVFRIGPFGLGAAPPEVAYAGLRGRTRRATSRSRRRPTA